MSKQATPSPPGMRVPTGGSCCANCKYLSPEILKAGPPTCANRKYIDAVYKIGKNKGDARFIDGKTGTVVEDPNEFCCNLFDWDG